MREGAKIKGEFTKAANMSYRAWVMQIRVDAAVSRMNDRFEKCEPALTQARYRDMLTNQGSMPELKPSFADGNPSDRMWKTAKQYVQFEHRHRLNKIRATGERMLGRDRGLDR